MDVIYTSNIMEGFYTDDLQDGDHPIVLELTSTCDPTDDHIQTIKIDGNVFRNIDIPEGLLGMTGINVKYELNNYSRPLLEAVVDNNLFENIVN